MNNLGSAMRERLAIQYYNEAGAKESGIDVGGLFKEFWTDLKQVLVKLQTLEDDLLSTYREIGQRKLIN